MEKKAEAYAKYNKAAVAEMMIKAVSYTQLDVYKRQATGAVARKLTTIIYAVVRESKPYEPKKFC